MSTGVIVIVGAGQAGAVAAHALRDAGFAGRVVMLGRELHRPYERPPLSKAVLVAPEEPRLDVLTDEAWLRCKVDWVGGTSVVELRPAKRILRLSDGRTLAYDKCLLATGGEARVLPALPPVDARVHYLRTLDDARRLREALRKRAHVVVLGGGFLGLEVAHSALAAGASVTVIEAAPALLERFLPAEASAWVEATLRASGARLLLGTSVAHAAGSADGPLRLETAGGVRVDADEVVVAIGLTPNDALAHDAGLTVAPGGGVLVDADCRTSDADIFACGDCASQQLPGQTRPTRMESWQNANEQARAAAVASLGGRAPVSPFPWFWTDQGRHNIQMLGLPGPGLAYVRRGDAESGKALWIGHREGVPVHGVAINAGGDLRAVRPLFDAARAAALHEFADPAVNLRAWARQSLAAATATH